MKEIDVIGHDPGYGDIKNSFRDESGKIVNFKYSSLVAEAPSTAIDMPIFEKVRYFTGEDALMRSSSDIIEITEYLYLEKFQPIFVWKSLKDHNINKDRLKYIVSGLSFSQMSKGRDFKKRISKFRVNNELFDFKDRVLIVPQAASAKYAIDHFYPDGPSTYLVVDIGQSTIDVADIVNGQVRPENVHGYKDEGIIRIGRNIQDLIAERFKEHVSLKEVKEILETKVYFLEGKEHDLSQEVAEFSRRYTEITINTLKSRFQREFKKYRKIYFVGGGAHYIDLSADTSGIIEVLPNPEYYNSIGNLLRGEQEIRRLKKEAKKDQI